MAYYFLTSSFARLLPHLCAGTLLAKCRSFLLATALFASSASAAQVHVAPNGCDTNPGSADKPVLTLERARDAMRGKGGGDIILHGGSYVIQKPLVLTPADSNTRYVAARGETPVITSARAITGWKLATPTTKGLVEDAKGKVWVADVAKGWRFHFLFIDGIPATRSRSVNHERWREWGRAFAFGKSTPTGQTITFENKEMLRNLPSNGDVELCVILFQYGVMGGGVMTGFDPEKGTGLWNSKQGCLGSGRLQETGFRLENALSLTDEPGEWAVDSENGKVYYWPKAGENLEKKKVTAPVANELVVLQGNDAKSEYVKKVVFEGITFAFTDRLPEDQWPDSWPVRQWENPGGMILMEGVEDCAIRNCRLYRSGAYGVSILRHALRNEVAACEIGYTGCGGVQLFGFGAGFRDEHKNNVIRKNYIPDQGTSIYWHSPNIQIFGSGANVVEYNFLALSAYNNVSITGLQPRQLNGWTSMNTPRKDWVLSQPQAVDFRTYPDEVMAQLKAGKPYFNEENYRELAVHSRDNRIERNVAFECHTRLEEGGALYTWCPGKGNQFIENVIYKSHALPGSSIISLDDHSEYLVVKANVVWCEGKAGAGTIGVRKTEKGNTFTGNIRSFDQYGDAKHCQGEPGREKFDSLYQSIKAQVDKAGGWPGNPDLNAMIEGLKHSKEGHELTPEQIKTMHKIM